MGSDLWLWRVKETFPVRRFKIILGCGKSCISSVDIFYYFIQCVSHRLVRGLRQAPLFTFTSKFFSVGHSGKWRCFISLHALCLTKSCDLLNAFPCAGCAGPHVCTGPHVCAGPHVSCLLIIIIIIIIIIIRGVQASHQSHVVNTKMEVR